MDEARVNAVNEDLVGLMASTAGADGRLEVVGADGRLEVVGAGVTKYAPFPPTGLLG